MTTKLEEFLKRTHDNARPEREIITTALAIADAVTEKAGGIRADKRLSPIGRQSKVLEMAMAGPWAHLSQLRDRAQEIRTKIEMFRGTLVPKQPDPTDLVRELRLQELRGILLDAKRADRLRLATTDDAFAEAALLAHPMASGLNAESVGSNQASEMDMVRDAYRARHFPTEVAGIKLREQAIEAVDSAIAESTRLICEEAGISPAEIEHLVAQNVKEAA